MLGSPVPLKWLDKPALDVDMFKKTRWGILKHRKESSLVSPRVSLRSGGGGRGILEGLLESVSDMLVSFYLGG